MGAEQHEDWVVVRADAAELVSASTVSPRIRPDSHVTLQVVPLQRRTASNTMTIRCFEPSLIDSVYELVYRLLH